MATLRSQSVSRSRGVTAIDSEVAWRGSDVPLQEDLVCFEGTLKRASLTLARHADTYFVAEAIGCWAGSRALVGVQFSL